MPRICTICNHDRISDINDALIRNESYRSIAKRFEASESAVYRHQQDHLPRALSIAKLESEQIEATTLFERLRALNAETQAILREAREAGNNGVALQAIQRAEKQLELEARLLGELDESVKIAVGVQVESREVEEHGALFAEAFTPDELVSIRDRLLAAQARKVTATTEAALPNGAGN